jgi:hypothetical protein
MCFLKIELFAYSHMEPLNQYASEQHITEKCKKYLLLWHL